MAAFWKLLGTAVGAAVIALTLRSAHKPLGMGFSLLAGAVLLLALAEPLTRAVEMLRSLAEASRLGEEHPALLCKLLGVSLAADFAAQACRDAGEAGLALRVELGGKVMLLGLCAPLLQQLAQLVLDLTA